MNCGDRSGDGGLVQGVKEAVPEGLVKLLTGNGGEANEFDSEDLAVDPADFAQVDCEGRRLIGQEDSQSHVAAGERRPTAGNGTTGCGEVYQRAFSDKGGAAENDGKSDGETIGGPYPLFVSHACPR